MERINLKYWSDDEIRRLGPQNFVKRDIGDSLIEALGRGKILFIFGPRQSGKTSLVGWLIQQLIKKGVKKERINYISLDFFDLHTFLQDTRRFVQLMRDEAPNSARIYLFIDELQRFKDPGVALKQIYDMHKEIQIIATGSSSSGIKERTKEALTGRKIEFTLFPFSFREFLRAGGKLPEARLKTYTPDDIQEFVYLYGNQLIKLWNEYVKIGGYPEIVLSKERKEWLYSSLYSTYLDRDVGNFIRGGDFQKFQDYVRLLASETGRIYNREAISAHLARSRTTIEKFEDILMTTFVLIKITPFYSNIRKELTKSPKFYFVDTGFRNFVAGERLTSVAKSFVLENAVVAEASKTLKGWELHWWKTKGGAEVDLILKKDDRIIPVEIKGALKERPKLTRSFVSFLKQYRPNLAFFLTPSLFQVTKYENTQIYFLPVYSISFLENL